MAHLVTYSRGLTAYERSLDEGWLSSGSSGDEANGETEKLMDWGEHLAEV